MEPLAPGSRDFVLSVQTDKYSNGGVKHFVGAKNEDRFQLMDANLFDAIASLTELYQKEEAKAEEITRARPTIQLATTIALARATTCAHWGFDHGDIGEDSAHLPFNKVVCKEDCFQLMGSRQFTTIVKLMQFYQKEHLHVKAGGRIIKKLCDGSYCEVHEGKLKKRLKNGKDKIVNVAIKLEKLDTLTKEQIKDILREARIMRDLKHPNVVKLYGLAAGQDPLMLVMKLAPDGDLETYLGKNRLLSQGKRMEMICQAAWGIDYLHGRNVIHRDIAVRSCLYGGGMVKISSFCLLHQGDTYRLNKKSKVPFRWLPPETFKTGKYSRATDVWSWGVLVWEIFSNCFEPYPDMNVREVIDYVKGGSYLDIDEKMDNKSVAEMVEKRAFAYVPEDRWTMNQIVKELEKMTGLKQEERNKDDKGDKTTFTNAPTAPNVDPSEYGASAVGSDSVDKGKTSFQYDSTPPVSGSGAPSITARK